MKKSSMLNRIMSFGLALALSVASPVEIYAAEVSTVVSGETIVSNTSEGVTTTVEGESTVDATVDNAGDEKSESGASSDANQADSDVSKSEDSKSSEKVNKDDADKADVASEAESDSENETDKDADEDVKIEYEYVSNNDGTHTKKWTDADGVEHSEVENCSFNEDGTCKHCGYEKEDEDGQKSGEFTAKIDNYEFKVNVPEGSFDEAVYLVVKEVSLDSDQVSLVTEQISEGYITSISSFDISFKTVKSDEEVEPKEKVSVSIKSSEIEKESEVIHISDDKVAEVVDASSEEGKVDFEADSFSVYSIVGINKKFDEDQKLFYKTAYGSAFTDEKFAGTPIDYVNASWISELYYRYHLDFYAVQFMYKGSALPFAPDQLGTSATGRSFIYDYNCGGRITLNLEAPENYYIKKITVTDGNNNVKDYTPSGSYPTVCTQKITLVGTQGQAKKNVIRLEYERIPSTLKRNNSKSVDGATFINYKNDTQVFGSDFWFNGGKTGNPSDHCHYGQVYQNLANSNLENGVFKLSTDNGKLLFPTDANKKYYSYVTDYHYNAKVQFNKDSDGYWTLDSSQSKYVFNKNTSTVVPTWSDNQFRPFDGDDNHFGMELPLNFTVSKDGKTDDGKDTIFRFSGDDDVFVYIDGNLVLDLGGIHNAVYGQINFATGDILIQGNDESGNVLTSSVDSTCYYDASKAKGTKLYDLIPENNVAELSAGNHVLTVVYFERGAHLSNCRISYNFATNETRNVSYEGLKIDENGNPLAGATFALYEDEACQQIAKIGLGVDAVSTSDNKGTIKFDGLSAGVIKEGNSSVEKTYYMKETAAPDGYQLLENAKWKLVITAKNDGSFKTKLTAINSEAQSVSLDKKDKVIKKNTTEVKSIKNEKTKIAKTLTVSKTVSDGTSENDDPNAKYVFVLYEIVNDESSPLANQKYVIDGKEYETNADGQFTLKDGEKATFDTLYGVNYGVSEIGVENSAKNRTINDFDTRIIINDDYSSDKIISYEYSVKYERIANVSYLSDDGTAKTTASMKFENLRYVVEETDPTEPTNRKYISAVNEDGTYDLTLDFVAPYKTITSYSTVPVDEENTDSGKYDIVVVFDTSGSIDASEMNEAKNALKKMVSTAAKNNSNIYWKLIDFNDSATLKTNSWENNNTFLSTINAISSNSDVGTNYDTALMLAKRAVDTSRNDAKKVVIFVTDGVPTRYDQYYEPSTEFSGPGHCISDATYEYALDSAGKIECDYFYSVGIGLSDTSLYHTDYDDYNYRYYFNYRLSAVDVLDNITNAPKAGVKKVYSSSDFSTVSNELTAIAENFTTQYAPGDTKVTNIYTTQVKIEDVLSEYVEFAEDNVTYTYKVTDAEGEEISNASFTKQESYDSRSRKLTVTINNEKGLNTYKYSVTFKIKPTQKAYDEYINNGYSYYPNMVGEENTGVSSENKLGFYSNDWAKVSFTLDGSTIEKDYKKPVVQIDTILNWQLIKVSASADHATLAGAEFILAVPSERGAEEKYYGKSDDNGVVQWYRTVTDRDYNLNPVKNIPNGTYVLSELKAPNGYAVNTDVWEIEINKNSISAKNKNTNQAINVVSENVTGNQNASEPKVLSYKLYFENQVAYTLPETGGSGVYVYTIGGILLMIAGALLLYKNKKNNNK